MRIEDIKAELEDHYKCWKASKKTLENNECFSEDRSYFKSCEIYHSTNFHDLYSDYTKCQYFYKIDKLLTLESFVEKYLKELEKLSREIL